jgi:polyphenol oxidase
MDEMSFIEATWPAPSNVVGLTTTRSGGVSTGPYASFNLGDHVGDRLEDVLENRRRLREQALCLDSEPFWLNQVHGITVARIESTSTSENPISDPADASYTQTPGKICAVLTADCLPVLLCNREGTEIAAIHVGWRGCLAGILANTVNSFQTPPSELLAWLGPCIGPKAFEVGPEVCEAFVSKDPAAAEAFQPGAPHKFNANLYQLATLALTKAGVNAVYGGDYCTVSDQKRFFSYRRDGVITGRMATLIYFL